MSHDRYSAGLAWPRSARLLAALVSLALGFSLAEIPAGGVAEAAAPRVAVASGPAGQQDPERSAAVKAARARGKRVEVMSARTAQRTEYANPNGTFTLVQSTRPVRARAKDGSWVPVDTGLVSDAAGLHPKAVMPDVAFSPTGVSPLATAADGFRRVGLGWEQALAAPAVVGARASYPLGDGTRLVATAQPSGFSLNVVLTRPPAAAPVYRLPLTLTGLTATARPEGGFVLRDAAGAAVFEIAPPVMWDARVDPVDGSPLHPAPVPARLVEGKRVLELAPGPGFFADPKLVYPVTIDPTISSVARIRDTYVNSANPDTSYSSDLLLRAGGLHNGQKNRALLLFETDPALTETDIVDAELALRNVDAGSCTPTLLTVYPIAQPWSIAANWNNQPAIDTTTPYETSKSFAHGNETLGCANATDSIDVTAMVEAWVAGAIPNHGFELRTWTENSEDRYKAFCSANDDPAGSIVDCRLAENNPTLSVTYNDTALTLLSPRVVRSNGAELRWRHTPGTMFSKYEVHRSTSFGFTPSASTLLATLGDGEATSFQDTTAASQATYYYRVVGDTTVSNRVTAVTPDSGNARVTLQMDPRDGVATYVSKDTVNPPVCYNWYNRGATTNLRVGTTVSGIVHRPLLRFDLSDIPAGATVSAATLTLDYEDTDAVAAAIDLHRITRAWHEGTTDPPACTGSGASWYEATGGVRWSASGGGGDFDPTADGTIPAKTRGIPSRDSINVQGLVQEWVSGSAPNHGMLLKLDDETIPASGVHWFDYASDDHPTLRQRPTLTVTYADGSASRGPRVALSAPGPGATVRGPAVRLAATAVDDRRVTTVEFLVDGAVAGSDTTAPFEITWNSSTVANGLRTVIARATDNVGNTTTSAPVTINVDNAAAPAVSVTVPIGGATVSGTVSVTATASAGSTVEFSMDGSRFDADATAPYQVSWNTLDAVDTAYDGTHTLTARAIGPTGQVTTSAPVQVTVANRTGTQSKYKASFDLNAPGTADDPSELPLVMVGNELATPLDAYPGSPGTRNLKATPNNDNKQSVNAFRTDVTVTNNSTEAWNGQNPDIELWYRWYTEAGVVLFEGPGNEHVPTLQPGTTRTVPVTVEPPAAPLGTDITQLRLRFDLYNAAETDPQKRWFAANGNAPKDNPVLVVKQLEGALGLERYNQYEGENVGAGMTTLTNVANGNMLLRYSPFFDPGRGLATMVDLTYNALEDHSDSPAGNNWSLAISGLSRLGAPIDIHPNKADTKTGRSNKYVVVTDGDGTTHRFTDGVTGGDGITRFTEPPGVNLYLRSIPTNPPERRWALTRPDNVTFFYDIDGFPRAVVDRNGNTLTFTLEPTPPGEDPGGPKMRITAVSDAAHPAAPNRSFTIDYYSQAEAKKAHVRGQIQRITDHDGSALDFDYYDDGNLLRITQRGGLTANGEFLADRSFVFTYTTSSGALPAIPNPADRANPDPKTADQSARIYSVRDPRGHETTYDYYGPAEGPLNRWKLQTRTNRAGKTTSFGYDPATRTTTVAAPMARVTRYAYDTTGKVTRIVNPKDETTTVEWSTDFKVTKVTEPTGQFSTYDYNSNGYPTLQANQLNETTRLTYLPLRVDDGDTGNHLSLLSTLTTPNGDNTPADPTDYRWTFSYDGAGNPDRVTDPTGAVTDYDYNLAGSANPGTLAQIRDANGNPPTVFEAYDPSGQPTRIRDPLGNLTQLGHDLDGRLTFIQDPNHQSGPTGTGTDLRAYRTYFDYDAFGRLGRQSAPKSTRAERGRLIWSGVDYDPNDNVIRRIDPHYVQLEVPAGDPGAGDPEDGPTSTASYDDMDRPLVVSDSDRSVDPLGERTTYTYDDAGRLSKITKPRGVATTAVTDDFTTLLAYDPLDRLSRQTDYGTSTADKRITHYCYDLAGDLISITAPNAALDTLPCPAAGTTPFTTRYFYDEAHRLEAQRDPLNHETRTSYDKNSNVTGVERDIQTTPTVRIATTSYGYDQRDALTEVREQFTGTRDITTKIQYDPNGNRSKLISPRAYDAAGGSSSYTNYVTRYDYDPLNRLIKTTLPFDLGDDTNHNGVVDDTEKQYVHQAYDANGNLAWTSLPVTTPLAANVATTAKTSLEQFDPGWIRGSDDPVNPKVRFDYTAQGWQSERTPDQAGAAEPDLSLRMRWVYDPDGQLAQRRDQGGQFTKYDFDVDDNLTAALDAAGVIDPGQKPVDTQATYTGFDQPAKVRTRPKGQTLWTFTDYTYDRNGNVSVRRDNGMEDNAGAQQPGGAPREHRLFYNDADWLTEQRDLGTDSACAGDEQILTFYWDTGWERERTLRRAGTGCTANPASPAWPVKQTTTWDHFDNGDLQLLKTKNGVGTITEQHEPGYIANGIYLNGHQATDRYILTRAPGSSATTCITANPCDAAYSYDARDRLISHQQRAGKVTSYVLDQPAQLLGDNTIRAGNVTSETTNGVVTTRTYQANQLKQSSTGGGPAFKYWYDNLGNLDCVTTDTGSQADCSPSDGGTPANLITDYTYDYLNRLASARQYSGGPTPTRTDKADYTYDAVDRVVEEVEDHAGTGNDRTTAFTFQGLTNLVTRDVQTGGSNPRTKTYSYDAYGNRISLIDKSTTTGAGDPPYSYGHDVHGSVSQLLTDSGAVKASYGYTAYGGVDATDPQALTSGDPDALAPINPYRYSGKRLDSGLATSGTSAAGYDMGARRYGPDTTRFLQQDLFYGALANLGLSLDPLTQNPYALAGGNPISFIELDGHMADSIGSSERPLLARIRDENIRKKTRQYDPPCPDSACAWERYESDSLAQAAYSEKMTIATFRRTMQIIGAPLRDKRLREAKAIAEWIPGIGSVISASDCIGGSLLSCAGVVPGIGKGISKGAELGTDAARAIAHHGDEAANTGGAGARSAETVLSGHGGIDAVDEATTVVPKGTCISFYCAHGDTISDSTGNAIETGRPPVPFETFGPGETVPNYWLESPTGLNIMGNPVTVSAPTRLSELLGEGMGACHWAACRSTF